ncbi:MAG: hypothetical protein GX409_07810 [candidate division Zixibacteria bacterium]|nr:hypothetical protein [candidate division Zixibacteria bacterium]
MWCVRSPYLTGASGTATRRHNHETQPARYYRIEWDGTDDSGESVTSGISTYRLTAGDVVQIKKMSLIK